MSSVNSAKRSLRLCTFNQRYFVTKIYIFNLYLFIFLEACMKNSHKFCHSPETPVLLALILLIIWPVDLANMGQFISEHMWNHFDDVTFSMYFSTWARSITSLPLNFKQYSVTFPIMTGVVDSIVVCDDRCVLYKITPVFCSFPWCVTLQLIIYFHDLNLLAFLRVRSFR